MGARGDVQNFGGCQASPAPMLTQALLLMDIFILDNYVVILFFDMRTAWGEILGTQITLQGWIFWTMIFFSLKKFTVFLQCLFYSFGQNSKVIIADIIMIMTMKRTKKQDTKNEKKGNIFFKFL